MCLVKKKKKEIFYVDIRIKNFYFYYCVRVEVFGVFNEILEKSYIDFCVLVILIDSGFYREIFLFYYFDKK